MRSLDFYGKKYRIILVKTSSGKGGGDRGSGLFRNDLAASGENFFFLPIIDADGRRRRRKFDQIC